MDVRRFAVQRAEGFLPTLRRTMQLPDPVVIDVAVDYSHNTTLDAQALGQALI
jgi:thiamine pyrophosphate-dependent acetolactate synthase large subunit-like protein